jgi:DNA-binding response OmpR family regulator
VTRVLVADDDADIRDLVVVKLESAGFDVATATDGQAALDQVRADPPDLVLLDVTMPRLTGIEVCAALRGSPATATMPIILLTADAAEPDGSDGADGYVRKPFSPRDLLSRVQSVLSRPH